jgi:hypothetical protein
MNKYYNIVDDVVCNYSNVIILTYDYNYVEYFFGSIWNFWIL